MSLSALILCVCVLLDVLLFLIIPHILMTHLYVKQVKRRRSSAQPQLGRASAAKKQYIISPPTLSEASEEEESEPEPMRKVGRSNKDVRSRAHLSQSNASKV